MRDRFRFLVAAYDTAQGMIRFVDEKGEALCIIYGVLLALLTLRVDGVVVAVMNPKGAGPLAWVALAGFCGFLAVTAYALIQVVSTVRPRFVAPPPGGPAGGRRRLYWFQDVLSRDRDAYAADLRAMNDATILEEMAHELYDAHQIEEAKFRGIRKATRVSVAGFSLWLVTLILSFYV